MSGPLVEWDMSQPETHKRIWVDAQTHRVAKMQAAAAGVTLEAYIRRLVLADLVAAVPADFRW